MTKKEVVKAIVDFAKKQAEEHFGNTLEKRYLSHIQSSARRALEGVINLAIGLAKPHSLDS